MPSTHHSTEAKKSLMDGSGTSPLTVENLRSRDSSEGSDHMGNFYTLKRPQNYSPNKGKPVGYDSDSSRGSSDSETRPRGRRGVGGGAGSSSSGLSSVTSDVVVDFVFDSDDESGREESDVESESAAYRLSVPSWCYQSGGGDGGVDDEVVLYTIAIDSTQPNTPSWTVTRTFSQFYEWRAAVASRLKHLRLKTKFPELEYNVAPLSSDQLDRRCTMLSSFLKEISRHHAFAHSPQLLAFLHPDGANTQEYSMSSPTATSKTESAMLSPAAASPESPQPPEVYAYAEDEDSFQHISVGSISKMTMPGGGDSKTWRGVGSSDDSDWRGNPTFLGSILGSIGGSSPSASTPVASSSSSSSSNASLSPPFSTREQRGEGLVHLANAKRESPSGFTSIALSHPSPSPASKYNNDYEGTSSESEHEFDSIGDASSSEFDDLGAEGGVVTRAARDGSESPLLRGYGNYGSGFGAGRSTGLLAALSVPLTHVLSATATPLSLAIHSRFGCYVLSKNSSVVQSNSVFYIDSGSPSGEPIELEIERGVFHSGIVWKWPTANQNIIGRITKRLLVVRGTELTYYNNKTLLGIDGETPLTLKTANTLDHLDNAIDENGFRVVAAAEVTRPTGAAVPARSRPSSLSSSGVATATGPSTRTSQVPLASNLDARVYHTAVPMYSLSLAQQGTTVQRSNYLWKDCIELKTATDTVWFRVPVMNSSSNSSSEDSVMSSSAGESGNIAALLDAAADGAGAPSSLSPPPPPQHPSYTERASFCRSSSRLSSSSATSAASALSSSSTSLKPSPRYPSPPVVCATASLPQVSTTPAVETRWLRELSRSISQGSLAQQGVERRVDRDDSTTPNTAPDRSSSSSSSSSSDKKKKLHLTWYHQEQGAFILCVDAVPVSVGGESESYVTAMLIVDPDADEDSAPFCLDVRMTTTSATHSSSPPGRRICIDAVLASADDTSCASERLGQSVFISEIKLLPIAAQGSCTHADAPSEVTVLLCGVDGSVGLVSVRLDGAPESPSNRVCNVKMYLQPHAQANPTSALSSEESSSVAVSLDGSLVASVYMAQDPGCEEGPILSVWRSSFSAATPTRGGSVDLVPIGAQALPSVSAISIHQGSTERVNTVSFARYPIAGALASLIVGTSCRLVLAVLDPAAAAAGSCFRGFRVLDTSETPAIYSLVLPRGVTVDSNDAGADADVDARAFGTCVLWKVYASSTDPLASSATDTGPFSVVQRDEWSRERLREAASEAVSSWR